MLKLTLGKQNWVNFVKRDSSESFSQTKERIQQRDQGTCCYCGFQAESSMLVINKDGNYANNSMVNMHTACPLCVQCLFLEQSDKVGSSSGGTLIYLPEISQEELNGLTHVMFCSIANATVHEEIAQQLYNSLRLRKKYVENAYGELNSDPVALGCSLINTPTKDQSIPARVLKDLRLLASMTKFREQIVEWSKQAASQVSMMQEKS